MKINNIFSTMQISASGLSAQRKRMNVIADNMANSESTRSENGEPYRRKIVSFRPASRQALTRALDRGDVRIVATNRGHIQGGSMKIGRRERIDGGVKAIQEFDNTEFKMIYDPGHPDANEDGYVKMPNINVVSEMVDMIAAARAYEANTAALNALKNMAQDSLEIR